MQTYDLVTGKRLLSRCTVDRSQPEVNVNVGLLVL